MSHYVGVSGVSLQYTCGNYIASPSFQCSISSEGESQALEVQDITTSMIYASGGDNPMSYEEFITYSSPVGKWSLNTPRNLQFESNCFFKSPTIPSNCTSDECIEFIEIMALNMTTWASLAQSICGGYFPSGDTNIELGPAPAGQVIVTPISKCQNMTFAAGPQYVLTDQYGNSYIMHASGANTTDGVAEAVSEAQLPEGWSIAQETLDEDYTIYPDMDEEGNCYYTIIRDSSDNSYHMIGCDPARARPTDLFEACPAAIKSSMASTSEMAPSGSPETSDMSSDGYKGLSIYAAALLPILSSIRMLL